MTEVKGLPVAGYKPTQSQEAIDAVTRFKLLEEQVLREIEKIQKDLNLEVDPRWLATGKTDIEKGFMFVNRSIFKPGRVSLPDD